MEEEGEESQQQRPKEVELEREMIVVVKSNPEIPPHHLSVPISMSLQCEFVPLARVRASKAPPLIKKHVDSILLRELKSETEQ
jgi:hypothetical protein